MGYLLLFIIILVACCFIRKPKQSEEPIQDEPTYTMRVKLTTTTYDDTTPEQRAKYKKLDKEAARMDAIDRKYRSIADTHYKLENNIRTAYSVARQLHGYNSPEMNRVIEMCKKDIAIAPTFLEYLKEYNTDLDESRYPILFDAFKRLAIIYEKQKEYLKAADVCKQAINTGILNDGTEGGYPGRYAKMIKLATKKIEAPDNAIEI